MFLLIFMGTVTQPKMMLQLHFRSVRTFCKEKVQLHVNTPDGMELILSGQKGHAMAFVCNVVFLHNSVANFS